ncbi:hypothetical protein OJF2_00740 [Aquisphaera giovannonii]|uniref:Uncharacterized protein n=1 Tax=Aquisphaera giovannonii TaxID=406548 RepID=A0A5B9VU59_9BACT|nr:hypothetical protein [Aquisphaera giovannonii]QEH31609.1 hypothetical protein OJF2_00740 [Aquisphaera giovannonii]
MNPDIQEAPPEQPPRRPFSLLLARPVSLRLPGALHPEGEAGAVPARALMDRESEGESFGLTLTEDG